MRTSEGRMLQLWTREAPCYGPICCMKEYPGRAMLAVAQVLASEDGPATWEQTRTTCLRTGRRRLSTGTVTDLKSNISNKRL